MMGVEYGVHVENVEMRELISIATVSKHLYNRGFQPNFYVWTAHNEEFEHGHYGFTLEICN